MTVSHFGLVCILPYPMCVKYMPTKGVLLIKPSSQKLTCPRFPAHSRVSPQALVHSETQDQICFCLSSQAAHSLGHTLCHGFFVFTHTASVQVKAQHWHLCLDSPLLASCPLNGFRHHIHLPPAVCMLTPEPNRRRGGISSPLILSLLYRSRIRRSHIEKLDFLRYAK